MIHNYKIHRQEIIELCQTLVRTPSVNGMHTEKGVAEAIAQFTKDHNLEVEVIGQETDRPNVLVRVGPSGEAALLLVAHTDTVAVGREENWTYHPFGAEIVKGRMYGRGTIDNKGGLVAAIAALLMLKENYSEPLQKPVVLVCVPDEESGATGRLGIRYLKELGKLSGSGAIYTYPGMHRVIIGHRGVLRMKVILYGKALHSGSTRWVKGKTGCNAVAGMAEIILALEQLKFNRASNNDPFGDFGAVITPTLIKGGADKSIVPDYCEAIIDIRFTSSVLRDEIEEGIHKVVAEVIQKRTPLKAEVVQDIFVPPTLISPDSKIAIALRKSAKQVFGKDPAVTISGPANESYILNEFGIPTCVFGPNGGHAHASDEYVIVDSIFQVASVYALTARLMM